MEVTLRATKEILLRRSLWSFGLVLIVGALSASGWAQTGEGTPVPEYYGTYAVAAGKLIDIRTPLPAGTNLVQTKIGKLAGEDSTFGSGAGLCQATSVAQVSAYSVPEMPPDVQFLLYAQSSGMVGPMMFAQALQLGKISYIRNVQISGCSFSGGGPQVGLEGAWDLGFITGPIELRLKPTPNRQDMVLAVPSSPLRPGLYMLKGKIKEALGSSFIFAVSPLSEGEAINCVDLSIFTLASLGGMGRQEVKTCDNFSSTSTFEGSGAQPHSEIQPVQPDSTTMWDKSLALGQPVTFTMCREMSFTTCQRGTFSLGVKEVSFKSTNRQSVFAVAPSQVTVVRASASVRLRIGGKNYTFDFFPVGVTCDSNMEIYLNCPQEGIAQQLVVANYIAQTIPKLASGALGSSLPQPTPSASASTTIPSTPEVARLVEQLQNVIATSEKANNFRSPLDDQQLLGRIVAASREAAVPPWLLFGQAGFETTFGDSNNITTRDGVTFTDSSKGNAHNLFNIRPGSNWTGKVVVSPKDGPFRAYGTYDDCVADYLRLITSSVYKGKSLDEFINIYFPASENGVARVQTYINSIIQLASTLGFTVNRSVVPVP